MVSVLLRFRDFRADIDTIHEHQKLIAKAGKVYWGWWRKEGVEPDHKVHLERLKKQLANGPITIGIYDRSTNRYFSADLRRIFFRPKGEMKTPQKVNTPDYYENKELPAWFELHSITVEHDAAFVTLFGTPPIGEGTLHPLPEKKPRRKPAHQPARVTKYLKVQSDSLLHVSDIHFGDDFGDFKKGVASRLLLDILKDDLKDLDRSVGLIVQSGDITSRGNGNVMLDTGLKFMRAISNDLKVRKEHVVMIPGNHDYALDKHDASDYSHADDYNEFVKRFYGKRPYPLSKYQLPCGVKLEVLAIDSVKLRYQHNKNYGWVDWSEYAPILEVERKSLSDPNVIRIAVIHHHLAPAPRVEDEPNKDYPFASVSVTLNAGQVVEGLQKHGFKIVLHGHQHIAAMSATSRGRTKSGSTKLVGLDKKLYLIAGGSAGVMSSRIDPAFRQNSYGLLTFSKGKVKLLVRHYSPTGHVSDHYHADLKL